MCSARVARGLVLRYADQLQCSVCKAELRVSGVTRMVASAAGLLAGWGAVELVARVRPSGAWGLEILYAVIGFAVGSTAAIFVFADLQVRERHGADVFPQRAA